MDFGKAQLPYALGTTKVYGFEFAGKPARPQREGNRPLRRMPHPRHHVLEAWEQVRATT
jgi:hypothetical protein